MKKLLKVLQIDKNIVKLNLS